MPTYTPKQKADALETVATEGITAAATKHNLSRETLRKWAKTAGIVPFDARRTAESNARAVAQQTRAVVDQERTTRHAQAQAALGNVTSQQTTLVSAHQQIAARVANRVLKALARLDAADAAVDRQDAGAAELHREASKRLDSELARAKSASISFGVHVDKLLRLAGEDATAATATGVQAQASQVVTVMLTQDAEFRREVAASLADRYRAMQGAIETSSTPAVN